MEQAQEISKKEIKEPDKKLKKPQTARDYVSIVRILQTDIPGNKRILVGLTYIKGISWSISNAVCKILKINIDKKMIELSKKEIDKITEFLKNPVLPKFLYNRRKDFETGQDNHILTTQLDIKKEFDIRRLKKIRSYRGLRHSLGQPTRGQRTRSHFRGKGKKKTIGVEKKKVAKEPSKEKEKKKE